MWILSGALMFLPQFWMVLVLPVIAVVPFRRHRFTLVAALPLFGAALAMGGAQTLVVSQQACEAGPSLRVATANVLMSNERLDALARDVLVEAPDVVVFEELRHDLSEMSPELAAAYPYRLTTDTPWLTIASRLPLEHPRHLALSEPVEGREPLAAEVTVDGQTVTILAIHAQPPLNASTFQLHREQYRLLSEEAQRAPGPVIALGDFNATVLSPVFAQLMWENDFRAASAGEVPTHFPRYNLGLRIDHVLVRDLGVCSERVFDLTGSDHRGVAVDVALVPST